MALLYRSTRYANIFSRHFPPPLVEPPVFWGGGELVGFCVEGRGCTPVLSASFLLGRDTRSAKSLILRFAIFTYPFDCLLSVAILPVVTGAATMA